MDPRLDGFRLDGADEYQTPFLVFAPVTPHQLTNIERVCDTRYKALRFLYLNQAETLIIKIIPGPVHPMVTGEFVFAINAKLAAKGQGAQVTSMGGATYSGMESQKEADGALRPRLARRDIMDWPTVVVEGGVSEAPRRLAADARW